MNRDNKDISEENAESTEPAVVVTKSKKIFLKPLIISASILLALAIVGVAAYAVLAHFVLFPNFATALGNTLESKLDIGTEFDIAKLIDGGKITFEAEGMDGATEDASFTLSYNKNVYVANAVLDNYEIDLALTEKGMAYSSNKFNGGKAYGISFENIEQTLENSALYYENDGDLALTKDEFNAKLEALEALAADDKQIKKDLFAVYSEIAKAFEDSEISEYKSAYGKIKVKGDTRNARSQIYSFDGKALARFLSDAAERFDDPSDKLEDAVERLAKNEIFELISSYIGYRVEDAESLAKLLDKLSDSVKVNLGDAEFDLVIGYVGRYVSIVKFKITDGEDSTLLMLDFGAKPKLEYKVEFLLENTKGGVKSKLALDYGVNLTDDGRRAVLNIYNYACTDAKRGYYVMNESEISLDFRGKNEVSFIVKTVEEVFNKNLDRPEVRKTADMEALLEYTDSRDELVLELRKVTSDTKDETPKGDYKITVSTKPNAVKLPNFEKVFEMSESDYENYREEVNEFLKSLRKDESSGMEMIPEYFDLSKYFK